MPRKGQTVTQETRDKISRSLTGRVKSRAHCEAIGAAKATLDPEALTKRCPGCDVVKSRDDFHKNASARDGLQTRCKICRGSYDAVRDYGSHLKRLYGITLDQYNEMLDRQGGVCLICSDPPGKKSLAVDHCHDTGIVRGLLCHNCNRGLGWLKDDPELLRRSIDYLNGALS